MNTFRRKNLYFLFYFIGSVVSQKVYCQQGAHYLTGYNVVWDTPSVNSKGSMPLGNGDVGINCWAQKDGNLFFYIGKNDSWDENGRLLKLGRIRINIYPNPFATGKFQQTLSLQDGSIRISAGAGADKFEATIWVDANENVVRVQTKSQWPHKLVASLENWRKEKRALQPDERHSAYGIKNTSEPVYVFSDTIVLSKKGIAWLHKNNSSIWALTMGQQGLEHLIVKQKDPLLNRCFGGLMRGNGFNVLNNHSLEGGYRKNQLLEVFLSTGFFSSANKWLANAEQKVVSLGKQSVAVKQKAHCAWWNKFWKGSYVQVSGDQDADAVTRGYILQRFVMACSNRGKYPNKFNGSMFTVDSMESSKPFDADFRQWGGAYWLQNTRLIYWPMLAAGDFEMMLPFFNMYSNALNVARARTKVFFNHPGAYFPETIYFWGTYVPDNYGWDRTGKSIDSIDNKYIRYHYEGSLEVLAMMLDYYRYTNDKAFFDKKLLPFAEQILLFYQHHYSKEERDGKTTYRIQPAQALETYANVVNPLPVLAGLHCVLNDLLSLPEKRYPASLRLQWQNHLAALPSLPTGENSNGAVLLPAEKIFSEAQNTENCELYAVFPFRLYGVGKDQKELVLNTFHHRRFPGSEGWRQDDIQAAYLGLADTAKTLLVQRMRNWHKGSRFPAFWGPNFDWIPDQDHGSNGMNTLQTMLLQTAGEKIILFPSWPKEWDVNFKLHAPNNTIVEGVLKNGKIVSANVTPSHRKKDVLIMLLR